MSTARFEAALEGATSSRDLASVELWQRSLARSRQRRRLTEIGRKARRRRKSVSLALSAALAAGPVLPQGVAAADSGSGSGAASTSDGGDGLSVATAGSRVVLELGSRGPLVAAAQRRLNDVMPFTHLAVDGIYGELTRGAVVNFQRQHGLAATGALDVRTWASMFNAPVLIMGASGSTSTGAGPAIGRTATSIRQSSRRYVAADQATAGASGTPAIAARSADVGGSTSPIAPAGARAASSEAAARQVTTSPGDTSASGGVAQLVATGSESGSANSNAPAGAGGAPAVPGGNTANAGSAPANAGSASNAGGATANAGGAHANAGGAHANAGSAHANAGSAPAGTGASGTGSQQPSAAPSVTVVAPTNSTPQTSTYVLTDGVALPLPREYITNPYVDQGVDYAAPGGTPLYAMGDGVIVGAGISGFGPNAPILKITSGPLSGLEIYYGHSGSNLVQVGQQVKAGQQISQVGYGIVGISTGPHLEVGFYPPGSTGDGSKMLDTINGLLGSHGSGRVWASTMRASADRSSSAAGLRPLTASSYAASAPAPSSPAQPQVSAAAPPASTPAPSGGPTYASQSSTGVGSSGATSATSSPSPSGSSTSGSDSSSGGSDTSTSSDAGSSGSGSSASGSSDSSGSSDNGSSSSDSSSTGNDSSTTSSGDASAATGSTDSQSSGDSSASSGSAGGTTDTSSGDTSSTGSGSSSTDASSGSSDTSASPSDSSASSSPASADSSGSTGAGGGSSDSSAGTGSGS
ncbi:MAG: peptidoglycan DD-metalloendopeptidase family protein, partial [Solirubrobacterales bacterium]|nr:peptidoglycan DD-metalloendopeptidase family protein [Solirubrobacterales bacterium]